MVWKTKKQIWERLSPDSQDALRDSVEKWERIVFYGAADRGSQDCPLCPRFARGVSCTDSEFGVCPVKQFSRQDWCRGTPYQVWERYIEAARRVVDKESLRLAKAELRFLKGFLPKDEK